MGQQRDQEINQKIPWNKWKWGHDNPKSVRHWESNPRREIHSIISLLKEKKRKEKKRKETRKQEKAQINNLTLHLKELEKDKQRKPKVRWRKKIIKIRTEINEIV